MRSNDANTKDKSKSKISIMLNMLITLWPLRYRAQAPEVHLLRRDFWNRGRAAMPHHHTQQEVYMSLLQQGFPCHLPPGKTSEREALHLRWWQHCWQRWWHRQRQQSERDTQRAGPVLQERGRREWGQRKCRRRWKNNSCSCWTGWSAEHVAEEWWRSRPRRRCCQ